MNKINRFDFVVLGAGIVGLSLAKELKARHPGASILVVEKESGVGFHASGRNSGVLHSGIYYPVDSLKAKVCASGSKAMTEYCHANNLAIHRLGKVIVPAHEEEDPQIDILFKRAQANGVNIEIIDRQQLAAIEPDARTASGRALYSPNTSIVDPKEILVHLVKSLGEKGISFAFNSPCLGVAPETSTLSIPQQSIQYGHLYNATGQYSDKIAGLFGVGQQYVLLPFKGRYYSLRPDSEIHINGLIYPVPNLSVPFLGVHSVKSIQGNTYFGPSATPALGRENYYGLEGVNISDGGSIAYHLIDQYFRNKQGFRKLLHEETGRLFKLGFVKAAQYLVPKVSMSSLVPSKKVGIRPQLLDLKKHELVMDFVVERKDNTTHILNSISPAFTSAFSFAQLVLDGDRDKNAA